MPTRNPIDDIEERLARLERNAVTYGHILAGMAVTAVLIGVIKVFGLAH